MDKKQQWKLNILMKNIADNDPSISIFFASTHNCYL